MVSIFQVDNHVAFVYCYRVVCDVCAYKIIINVMFKQHVEINYSEVQHHHAS